ncbi:hypothetical protein PQR05_30040 [Paraburkholderia sediminicola]|uniref:hypothetical protein n=1 Tax=Paraburkholderia sediminicola TaxID=458836 RepID=UPI0038BB6ED4
MDANIDPVMAESGVIFPREWDLSQVPDGPRKTLEPFKPASRRFFLGVRTAARNPLSSLSVIYQRNAWVFIIRARQDGLRGAQGH